MRGDNPNKKTIRVSVPFNTSANFTKLKSNKPSVWKVNLISLTCSITRNGRAFTPITFNKITLPIQKKYKLPSTLPNGGLKLQQPFAQLIVDFIPDDSRTSDTYVITFNYNYDVTNTPSIALYSGDLFGLNLGLTKSATTGGLTYDDPDAVGIQPFTIKATSS